MKRCYVLLVALMAAVLVVGPAASAKAPMTAGGEKIKIFLLSDRGDPKTMTDQQFNQRNQVHAWMERDLIKILNKGGYEASLVRNRGEYKPGPGRYLLSVKIVSYNPGSKAARMFVGFGAGVTSLNNHYELFGKAKKPILAYDDGVGSSRDWKNCARKLNKNAIKRVSEKLRQKQ